MARTGGDGLSTRRAPLAGQRAVQLTPVCRTSATARGSGRGAIPRVVLFFAIWEVAASGWF